VKLALEHIGLAARDTTGLRDWYVRVLEARLVFDNGATPPAFLLELPGGPWLEIYPAAHARPETADNGLAGWRHLAFRVESIAEAKVVLASRGVAFDEPVKPAGGGGQVLFFADPEGNLLHLVERPAGSRWAAGAI
jgi:glyoxylase I family protein